MKRIELAVLSAMVVALSAILLSPVLSSAYGPPNFGLGPVTCDGGDCTLEPSNDLLVDGDLRAKNTGKVHFNGRAEWSSPADGKSVYCDDARATCYCVDHTAADTAVFYAGDCSSPGDLTVTGTLTAAAVSLTGDIDLADDVKATFGDSEDYWLVYNSTAAQYELWSTDCDGVGTDCKIGRFVDGTPDAIFGGDLVGFDRCISAPTTDVAPTSMIVTPAHGYAQGAQTASNLYAMGGLAEKYVAVNDYTLGSTDTVAVNVNSGSTTLTEGTHFDCITSNDVCATNLATAIDAITGVSAVAVAAVVYIQPDSCGIYRADTEVADGGVDGAFATETNGTDGYFIIGDGYFYVGSALVYADVPIDSRAYFYDGGGVACMGSSTCPASTWGLASGDFLFKSKIEVDGNSYFDGRIDTYGLVIIHSQYMRFDNAIPIYFGTSFNTRQLWATNQTNPAVLSTVGNTSHYWIEVEEADANTGVDFAFPNQTNPTRVWQSSDATHKGERVYIAYNHLVNGTAQGDYAPHDFSVVGPSAYSQATGASQTGGDLNHAVGIGTRQVTIDDYTQCGGAVVTVIISGSGTDLTEGVDWTAATSNDVTADSLASAITALAGVTAANPPAAIVYVVPDDATLAVGLTEDTAACTTVLNASDGNHNFWGGLNVFDRDGEGYYWHTEHMDAAKVSPGGSGATLQVDNTASLNYLLDAVDEYLYFSSRVHDCYDEDSDLLVCVAVALEGAETANDVIQAEIVAEYYGEHDDMDTPKTQTRTVDHDIVSDNGAGEVHYLMFVLDHDLVSHVIEADDLLKLRFRLDSVGGGTDVAAVRFLQAGIKHRSKEPNEPVGVFPDEG